MWESWVHWGAVMMRVAVIVASLMCAAVLAGCSSSSRVDGVVPGWANTHSSTANYAPARERAEPRTTGAATNAASAAAGAPPRSPALPPDEE
jgi:hypothetical protein